MRSPTAADIDDVVILSNLNAGRVHEAAELVISTHGPSLLRFLRVRLRSYEQADDAFSLLCEDIWVGLARFDWRASLRTWLFILARSAATRVLRDRKRVEMLRADTIQSFRDCCERVRTTTTIYQQTDLKQRVRALRERLDEDQQTLLILRIDQGIPWHELAIIMDEVQPDAAAHEHERAATRISTRYHVAKKRLRELALAAGLLPGVGNELS